MLSDYYTMHAFRTPAVPPLAVTGVSPASGPAAGGNTVTVNGTVTATSPAGLTSRSVSCRTAEP
jgi:hypothetical protein